MTALNPNITVRVYFDKSPGDEVVVCSKNSGEGVKRFYFPANILTESEREKIKTLIKSKFLEIRRWDALSKIPSLQQLPWDFIASLQSLLPISVSFKEGGAEIVCKQDTRETKTFYLVDEKGSLIRLSQEQQNRIQSLIESLKTHQLLELSDTQRSVEAFIKILEDAVDGPEAPEPAQKKAPPIAISYFHLGEDDADVVVCEQEGKKFAFRIAQGIWDHSKKVDPVGSQREERIEQLVRSPRICFDHLAYIPENHASAEEFIEALQNLEADPSKIVSNTAPIRRPEILPIMIWIVTRRTEECDRLVIACSQGRNQFQTFYFPNDVALNPAQRKQVEQLISSSKREALLSLPQYQESPESLIKALHAAQE